MSFAPKAEIIPLYNNLTSFVSFAQRTSDSRNGSAPAEYPSRMMKPSLHHLQPPRSERGPQAHHTNGAQRGKSGSRAPNGPTAYTLGVQASQMSSVMLVASVVCIRAKLKRRQFANVILAPMSTQSLAYLMPRGAGMYTPGNQSPYPFATLFKATPNECIPELLSVLPTTPELFDYLETFKKRVHICSFPHIPVEITRSEVERFLSDAKKNAQMCPDMLGLLFAALALGSQHSVWDKGGGQWKASVMKEELQKGDVYSEKQLSPIYRECRSNPCYSRGRHASSAFGLIYAQAYTSWHSSSHNGWSVPHKQRPFFRRLDTFWNNNSISPVNRATSPP